MLPIKKLHILINGLGIIGLFLLTLGNKLIPLLKQPRETVFIALSIVAALIIVACAAIYLVNKYGNRLSNRNKILITGGISILALVIFNSIMRNFIPREMRNGNKYIASIGALCIIAGFLLSLYARKKNQQ